MRYARRKDAPHAAIVTALRAAGALVLELEQAPWSAPGVARRVAGAPDLVVALSRDGQAAVLALEVKVARGAGRAQGANEDLQAAFRAAAHAQGLPAYVVTSPLEALVASGVRRSALKSALLAAGDALGAGGPALEEAIRAARARLAMPGTPAARDKPQLCRCGAGFGEHRGVGGPCPATGCPKFRERGAR